MLWAIFLILIVMWALGVLTTYILTGFIHILRVLVSLLIHVIGSRRIA